MVEQIEQEQFSTPDEWTGAVKANPRPLQLPSGAKIKVKARSSVAHAIKGQAPLQLAGLAIKAHIAAESLTAEDKDDLTSPQKHKAFADYFLGTVIDHVIEPEIVLENAGPGQMLLTKIPDDDLMAIYFDATGSMPPLGGLTGSVETFRDKWSIPRQRTGSGKVEGKAKRSNRRKS